MIQYVKSHCLTHAELSPDFILAFTESDHPPDVFDYAVVDREVPDMDQVNGENTHSRPSFSTIL